LPACSRLGGRQCGRGLEPEALGPRRACPPASRGALCRVGGSRSCFGVVAVSRRPLLLLTRTHREHRERGTAGAGSPVSQQPLRVGFSQTKPSGEVMKNNV